MDLGNVLRDYSVVFSSRAQPSRRFPSIDTVVEHQHYSHVGAEPELLAGVLTSLVHGSCIQFIKQLVPDAHSLVLRAFESCRNQFRLDGLEPAELGE